jgi:hypothetical protein
MSDKIWMVLLAVVFAVVAVFFTWTRLVGSSETFSEFVPSIEGFSMMSLQAPPSDHVGFDAPEWTRS